MKIKLIAVGQKMPAWVETGYQEYAKRLPAHLSLQLIEIASAPRHKNQLVSQWLTTESSGILAKITPQEYVVALAVTGQSWSTPALAQRLHQWQQLGQDVSLLIGGPDGLAANCLERANIHWSLSPLTLPHPLVRIMVAEQLYRAWSILSHHPYHRA